MKKSLVIRLKNKCLEIASPFLLRGSSILISDFKNKKPIRIKKSDFKYLTHSSFNVSYIDSEEVVGYFRECRPHVSRFRYIEDLLNDYYEYVTGNKSLVNELKSFVLKAMQRPKNMKRFFNMGVKNDFDSPVAKYLKNPSLGELIGVPCLCDQFQNELSAFIQFAWGEIYLYNMSHGLKAEELQTFNSNRQIATYLVAKELELNDLIPTTRMIKLSIDGQEKIGTLMDVAKGLSPEIIEENERHLINPQLQMQFMQLNLLDLICRQRDHRPNHSANYNIVVSEKGESQSVCAFDNDSPTSFFPSSKIDFTTSASTTPFIEKGIIKRPFICMETCDRILNLRENSIKDTLINFLSNSQIRYLIKRIEILKKSIETTRKNNSTVFLTRSQWTLETVAEELDYCERNHVVSYMYSYYHLL